MMAFRLGSPPRYYIKSIKFGVLSPEMVRKMSVVSLTVPDTYDEDGSPMPFGLMDRRMGTLEPGQRCETCDGRSGECPGHFGHIELALPVIHVGFTKHIYNALRATCSKCGRITLSDEVIEKKRRLLEYIKRTGNYLRETGFYEKVIKEAAKATKCPHCGAKKDKVKLEKPTTFYLVDERNKPIKHLSPKDVREWLEKIPDGDVRLIGFDPEVARPEWMVITVLPVPPISVRPSITLESGERSEDDLTHKLGDIVRTNEKLKSTIEAGSPQMIIDEHWNLLQYHISTYFDNELAGISPAVHRSGRPLKTLAQRLKGKDGRFRNNLSGKRVDFSARTVISPDPYISINEVGVPVEVAKILTVPEPVTEHNIDALRQLVINGPEKYPGANYIIRPDGRAVDLRFVRDREAMAERLGPGYIVERHLMDGDLVLFNRQPSLHRMSMMAHHVKVLPYKTFRINPIVCPPYNADFDGDEMNLHVPQSKEAWAEMKIIMRVQEQMLTPRYGGVIVGALHDYISSAYLLTRRQTKLDRFKAALILGMANYKGPLEKSEYTGKELFSLVLPKVDYEGEALMDIDPEDRKVVIKEGKLISGVIDHNAIGDQKSKTLLHKIILQEGAEKGREFLDNLSWMLLMFLDMYGFTMGLDEEDLPEDAKKEIKKVIDRHIKKVNEYIQMYREGKLEREPGATLEETLEQKIISELNMARDESGKIAERYFSPNNSVLITAKTGARGKMLNLTQMTACIGQQTIRGERIRRGYLNRTLPHFKPGDLGAEARGFIKSNYKEGLRPTEFFFHAMSGREGLVDTAVRTSQSGYMQRRLINALLDLHVEYDGTVQSAEGFIIQYLYGEDGIDPTRSVGGDPVDFDEIERRVLKEIEVKASA